MDEKFWSAATKLLEEMAQDLRTARERPKKPISWPNQLIKWFRQNWIVVSAIVTALWTLNTYFNQQHQRLEQQQREDLLRRQTMIVQFASDLSNKEKRNTSAYALAVLSGEEAVPFLLSQLKEVAQSDQDLSFREALIQSLIIIGEPSLKSILDLNRQAAISTDSSSAISPRTQVNVEAVLFNNTSLISATQPIIVHFMSNEKEIFERYKGDFSGVGMQNVRLAYHDLSNLDLSGLIMRDSDLFGAILTNANLEDIYIYQTNLSCVNFEGSILSGGSFFHSDFRLAKLNQIVALESDFRNSILNSAQIITSTLTNSLFLSADLERADFKNSELTGANFSKANAFDASFVGANLTNANFKFANLQSANFSNSTLQNTIFFEDLNDYPLAPSGYQISGTTTINTSGAFVKNANFEGAQNIDEDKRTYLCRWGATNIPGGCENIPSENLRSYGGSSVSTGIHYSCN